MDQLIVFRTVGDKKGSKSLITDDESEKIIHVARFRDFLQDGCAEKRPSRNESKHNKCLGHGNSQRYDSQEIGRRGQTRKGSQTATSDA